MFAPWMLLCRSNVGKLDFEVRGQMGNKNIPCLTFYLVWGTITRKLVSGF
jgi:hypothetical protein